MNARKKQIGRNEETEGRKEITVWHNMDSKGRKEKCGLDMAWTPKFQNFCPDWFTAFSATAQGPMVSPKLQTK